VVLVAVIPWSVPSIASLAQSAELTKMTRQQDVIMTGPATVAEVAVGRAQAVGEIITRPVRLEPVSIYFEEGVVRSDPNNPDSPKTGLGLFRIEVWMLAVLGVDVAGFNPAQLLMTRYVVDAAIPVLILIVVSLLTKPTDPVRVARFHVRMKTPVGATLEEDALAVEASYANPTRFDHLKLFPKSNWELTKWNRQDALGFLGCCSLVGFILLFFKTVLVIGS
jgi:solute:Na+ symporter, SSS family